jgi:hypothetical protein
MFRGWLDCVGTCLGITSVALLFFSLSAPSIAENTILVPGMTLSGPALATTDPLPAAHPKLVLDGTRDLPSILNTGRSRAEVSQQLSQVDTPAVEDGKVVGEKKKFLGGLLLYMLLKSQER